MTDTTKTTSFQTRTCHHLATPPLLDSELALTSTQNPARLLSPFSQEAALSSTSTRSYPFPLDPCSRTNSVSRGTTSARTSSSRCTQSASSPLYNATSWKIIYSHTFKPRLEFCVLYGTIDLAALSHLALTPKRSMAATKPRTNRSIGWIHSAQSQAPYNQKRDTRQR